MEGFFTFLSDEFVFQKKTLKWQKWSLERGISEKKIEKRKKTQKRNKTSSIPLKTVKTLQKLKGIGTCCGNGYSKLSAQ